ncbi:potassium/sodium hyperpolarization-activated cyclic nucleotide-gated channel 4 [Manduca sexta]|uniref:potassium/sodium hyperpolarization-activated cyclic nucleotide-gated channel 4 n=1 Tax=Manduca sexta TaxID=7130 RepID=UPI00188E3109|nr:potassium/sodium hyperpolarization-activated cyclic nucleotide-gated channel 4 [Manduca sexta]
MDSTGREVAHLRDGAFFGETCLLRPGTLRTATIIALEITEIYNVSSAEFQRRLQPYPHLKRRLDDAALRPRPTHSHNAAHTLLH